MRNRYSAPNRGAEYCDECVCVSVCVCVSTITSSELHVIFAHKPRLLDVAAKLKHSAHAALGLTINCAQ